MRDARLIGNGHHHVQGPVLTGRYWSFKSFDDITTTGDAGGGGESFYNKDGSVQDGKLRALTRAYARAIAGRPSKIKFENASGEEMLTLQYTVSTRVPVRCR